MSNTDNFMASSPSKTPPTVSEKPSLFRLLGFSVQIVGQFFPMVYPIFGYFVLSSLLVPQAQPDLSQASWWILFIGLMLVMFLFKAGWNTMMFSACQAWMRQNGIIKSPLSALGGDGATTQTPNFMASFRVLKDFLPGIGAYGVDYLLGCILEVCLLALPIIAAAAIAYTVIGVPEQYLELMTRFLNQALAANGVLNQTELANAVNALPNAEMVRVLYWIGLLAVGGLVTLLIQNLILYWEPIIRRDNTNAFVACWRSGKTALKHPFSTVGIWLYFNISFLFLGLLMGASELVAIVGNFVNILFIAIMGCYLYLYMHFYVSPVIEPLSQEGANKPDGNN